MGQGQSGGSSSHTATAEELSHRLSARFALKCFTDIELYSFRDIFKSLADDEHGMLYWSEDTMLRFLAIPDALSVGPQIFQASAFLGAFPFLHLAPAILNFESMVRVVAIFTGKYKVIMKGKHDSIHLIFRAVSNYERGAVDADDEDKGAPTAKQIQEATITDDGTFVIGDDDVSEDDDDDEMALAALDALDAIEVFKSVEKTELKFVRKVGVKEMVNLVMFLLITAPLDPQESLACYVERYSKDALVGLRRTAESIVRTMSPTGHPIVWRAFERAVMSSMPYIFDGLSPLFQKFLFSTKFNNNSKEQALVPPLLQNPGTIMDHNLLSQLSFFLKGDTLWRQLRRLYTGSEAGFSMGSFEQKVFKWRAPTILLISGSRLSNPPTTSREKSFTETLAPKRYPDGLSAPDDDTLIFGAYIPNPWKLSTRECFGDNNTKLFQLHPAHEVFETSTSHTDYTYFSKSSGIGVGSPLPKSHLPNGSSLHMNLGAVSLVLDESLEFGVFTHSAAGGGAFHSSSVKGREGDWQDRFEIEEIEVWGIGGKEEAEEQKRQWAWEEKEALARRGINKGGDLDSTRALLEMAGVIGGERSGGSM